MTFLMMPSVGVVLKQRFYCCLLKTRRIFLEFGFQICLAALNLTLLFFFDRQFIATWLFALFLSILSLASLSPVVIRKLDEKWKIIIYRFRKCAYVPFCKRRNCADSSIDEKIENVNVSKPPDSVKPVVSSDGGFPMLNSALDSTLSVPSVNPSFSVAVPKKRLTIILDLDETLINGFTTHVPPNVYITAAKEGINFFNVNSKPLKGYLGEHPIDTYTIFERPGLKEFLRRASRIGELIVFTAGSEDYASPVIDRIDPERRISHRLYRFSTVKTEYYDYVKDLAVLNRDLRRTVIVDNSPYSFLLQPTNGIVCSSFYAENGSDNELLGYVLPILISCSNKHDVRFYLDNRLKMCEWFAAQGVNVSRKLD